jgi:hypothetical protein
VKDLGLGLAEWAALIDEWRLSSLSQSAFCQLKGINPRTFQSRLYKPHFKAAIEAFRQEAQAAHAQDSHTTSTSTPTQILAARQPALPNTFVPLKIIEPSTPPKHRDHSSIEIILENGRRIAVAAEFDEVTLQRVITLLES